ncbi:MFS transporter [Qipengyuania gelatinilytica]|uniref:MFS transporter n=1 Tax=Qipengyuania gelatinilytica TaxID=2867231 RepID=A0ABX9A647_9SPHN|nr:MFS transporter [Qipengyuania gelatinilytica]QZD95794.1 MFS transporter [Qipengyuania gelatinilytica]
MSVIVDDPKLVYRRTLLFYALTTLPIGAMAVFFQNYFFIYATDVLLVAPAAVGTLLAAARIYDGVSDVAIATWSDRSESRYGRRRPFILVGGLMCSMLWAVFLVPSGMGEWQTIGWLFVALIWMQTATTLRYIPIRALGIESGTTAKARTFFGIFIPFITIPIVIAVNFAGQGALQADDPKAAVAPWFIGLSAATVVLTVVLYPLLKELPTNHTSVERNVFKMLKEVLGVGYHRQLIGVQFAESFAFTSLAFSVPYMLTYVIDRPDMIAVIFVTYFVLQRITGWGWYAMIPRWGMRAIWSKGLKLWLLVFAIIPLTLVFGFPVFALATAIAGVAGGAAAVNYAMLGDIADYDAKVSGRERQGIYMTIYRLVGNIGGAATGFALGWLLQLSGFIANEEQGEMAIGAIVTSASVLPFIGVTIGVWLLSRYRLYEREGMTDGRAAPGAAGPERPLPATS